ncbi:MAG: hypothetical protein AAGF77_10675 [Bacteroidota bacterium]
MKLSNVLLASMITSVLGVSAQEDDTEKDSLTSQFSTEIELPKASSTINLIDDQKNIKDSIKIRSSKKKVYKAIKTTPTNKYQHRCPGCGRG